MAEYFSTAAWGHNSGSNSRPTTPSRLQAHLRSLTPTPRLMPNKQVTKSISTPQLGKMTAVLAQPTPSSLFRSESEAMNTIPDPRSPTPQSAVSRNGSTDSNMISDEIATLSTKLINALNHQSTLDDTLQHTRHELESARGQVVQLDALVQQHEEVMASGLLVDKEVYDKMEKQLTSDLQEERRRRVEAEKAKRRVDSEVEALTSALFEEANTMVAAARKETEASEKRNEQLKQQLSDTETLLTSHQEQLQDLKVVMQQMSSDRDENESNTHATTTAPSTPGLTPPDKMSKLFEAANLTPNTPGSDEIAPDHPLRFSHLILPVLRCDLQSFKDFQEMLKITGRASTAPSSRVSSGNYGGLNVLGLGSLTNGSTSSLPAAVKSPSSLPASSPRDSLAGLPNLKDEKFYKRALAEDIEPTLRLDIAPGLSWMARRTVLNSMTTGSLVVEPHPPIPKFRGSVFPCALCGENRKGDPYNRKYRFKTSENEDAQRYPLCDWCLGRVRATCDYIGFLRMVAAGHWRAETEEERKGAWEESVRLRERMFWTRLGGGVVPAFIPTRDSPRSLTFPNGNNKDAARKSEESTGSNDGPLDSAVDMTEPPKETRKNEEDPFQSKDEDKVKRVSIGKTVISNEPPPVAETLTLEDEKRIEAEAEAQLQSEVSKSVEVQAGLEEKTHQRSVSTPVSSHWKKEEKEQRLSLTIPGAFE